MQPAKTAWDFLQLLVVPAILVVIALAFNAAQASRQEKQEKLRIREDRALAAEARRDAVLDAYLDKMSGLMLNGGLLDAKPGSAVSQVARTATLATVRRLDGSRKGAVVRFLYEAGLLRICCWGNWYGSEPVVDLTGADLRAADLTNAIFWSLSERESADQVGRERDFVALRGDLRGAKFDHADLYGVHFTGTTQEVWFRAAASLQGASFDGAAISDTRLSETDLRGASFKGVEFSQVNFNNSDLRGATFDNSLIQIASFNNTCLDNASFVGAMFNSQTDEAYNPPKDMMSFAHASGHNVDFSNAVNLSSVRLSSRVTQSRFDGAKQRPVTLRDDHGVACEPFMERLPAGDSP